MWFCNKCNKNFTSQVYLEKHNEKMIPCDFRCGECFSKLNSYSSYKNHMYKHHLPSFYKSTYVNNFDSAPHSKRSHLPTR